MTVASDVDDLVAILTGAGLGVLRAEGLDPALIPCVIVEAPTLDNGRRTTGHAHVLEVRCDLVAVASPDTLPYLDDVLDALNAGGVLIDSAVPTGHYAGDNVNPLPAYRITVRWPLTLGGTA